MLTQLLTPQLIIIVLVIIVIPIFIYFINKWYQNRKEQKGKTIIGDVSVTSDYTPPSKPKPGQIRITLSPQRISEITEKIKSGIHWYKDDDITSILSELYNSVRTKSDMGFIVDRMKQEYEVNLYDLINKNLTIMEQKEKFAKWLKDLPDYVNK